MALKREIIILGDIEMGGGTSTDDFISDGTLSRLIFELGDSGHPIDIVFNGDTFDFLKCPYLVNDHRYYPRHITEDISLAKLKMIYEAHKNVFLALRVFLKKKEHHAYFVLGNHDHDLMYPAVQEEIRALLQNSAQVHFPGLKYSYAGIYAEHGQQYDFLNKISFKHWYLTYNGKRILNIPWLSYGLISKFMFMKEKHPFMERVFPRPALFKRYRNLYKDVSHSSLIYLLTSMVYYPFRYHYDPTYAFPRELLREFYRRVKRVHWDVDKIISKFKRRKKKTWNEHRIHVLGHVHEPYLEEKKGKVFIHPGSWRDEYDLDADSGRLIPRSKKYVRIVLEDESMNHSLVTLPNERKTLDFDLVKMDEQSYIKSVAEEENYVFK